VLASFMSACQILRSTHAPLFWCDLQDATKQFISNNFTCHRSYPFLPRVIYTMSLLFSA
jgi:hypothetical protein